MITWCDYLEVLFYVGSGWLCSCGEDIGFTCGSGSGPDYSTHLFKLCVVSARLHGLFRHLCVRHVRFKFAHVRTLDDGLVKSDAIVLIVV